MRTADEVAREKSWLFTDPPKRPPFRLKKEFHLQDSDADQDLRVCAQNNTVIFHPTH